MTLRDLRFVRSERHDLPAAARLSAWFVAPAGLSRPALRLLACRAALAQFLGSRVPLGGVTVFVYREGTPLGGPFSAARVVYAPAGRWDRADLTAGLETWRLTVEEEQSYYRSTGAPALTVVSHQGDGKKQ